ncbi:MAG: GGDEF domain-containing protein [Ilumatobacteraceae bacterium]
MCWRHISTPPDQQGRSAYAVVMIDLNDFKIINDTHGHAAGDAVLVTIGRHLEHLIRAADLVARYAGDEYVVVLAGPISDDDAHRISKKPAMAAVEPVLHRGTCLDVGAAIGVAVGRSGESAAALIAQADAATYAAKRDGQRAPHGLLAKVDRSSSPTDAGRRRRWVSASSTPDPLGRGRS